MERDNDIVISVRNVTKKYKLFKNEKDRFRALFSKKVKYKTKVAINNLSFEVKRGESLALLGHNGAGKSTILKMITGVAFPTEGEIDVNGKISALLELSAGFDRESSGRDNIYLKCRLLGMNEKEIAEVEQSIIDFSGLEEYIDQPLRTYSSGMRARLGFAINTNIYPDILIVDEALSVGDSMFRARCLKKIEDIMSSGKVTFLFVTHSLSMARDFCKKGIVLEQGTKLFEGDIEEAIAFYEERYGNKRK